MAKKRKWIALFSQTGSEIVNVSDFLGFRPDAIYTNSTKPELFHPMLGSVFMHLHGEIEHSLLNYYTDDHIITLHGYLRILSPIICEKFEIYNGHPAPIHIYPELRGKDPQERMWNEKEKYDIIGSVIHQCTPELDAGEIVHVQTRPWGPIKSKDELYLRLKGLSEIGWCTFLKGIL